MNEEASVTFDEHYRMSYNSNTNTLTVAFGSKPTSKDHLVYIAKNQVNCLVDDIVSAQQNVTSGQALASKVLKITGPATNMITAVIVAALHNRVKAIAMYDVDQAAYVIVTNKDGTYTVGSVFRGK
jgi:hypothetical protein